MRVPARPFTALVAPSDPAPIGTRDLAEQVVDAADRLEDLQHLRRRVVARDVQRLDARASRGARDAEALVRRAVRVLDLDRDIADGADQGGVRSWSIAR
jgi:hypothetical protein